MSEVLPDIPNDIQSAGALHRWLMTAYLGWGYNAYNKTNQLRADDLIVRSRVSRLLHELRSRWSDRLQAFREEHLPPPTREHPFPDSKAVAEAKKMESVILKIEAMEAKIRSAPAPQGDWVWDRLRNRDQTLEQLKQIDESMFLMLARDIHAASSCAPEDFQLNELEIAWQNRQNVLVQ